MNKTVVLPGPGLGQQVEVNYSEFVADLFKRFSTPTESIFHAAVGIAGEAGELLDACKKVWAYNREPDVANICEELGDLMFYAEALKQQVPPEYHRFAHDSGSCGDIRRDKLALMRAATHIHVAAARVLDSASLDLDMALASPHPETCLGPATAALFRDSDLVMQRAMKFAHALDFGSETIMRLNVEKLLRRYPGGKYSDAAAWARADKVGVPA